MVLMRRTIFLIPLIFLSILLKATEKNEVSPDQAKKIAKEAYIFGLPMVKNYKTIYNYAIDESSDKFVPFNKFRHERKLLQGHNEEI